MSGIADDEAEVELLTGLSQAEAGEVELLLASMGITATSRHGPHGGQGIWVPASAVEVARRLVAEEFPDGRPPPPAPSKRPAPPLPRSTAGRFAAGALLAAMAAVFVSLHLRGAEPERADFLAHGAIAWTQIQQGEIWRFASATLLHFDALHLLANTAVFLVVAAPLADILGPLRFLAVFFATGIVGNVASHLISPSLALKGGASGGIAGLLGALAGHQLRPDRRSRFRRWQVLGALAAVYALMVGTGPGRDDVAHLGGLLAGIALGRLLPPRLAARAGAPAPSRSDPRDRL